MQVSPMTYVRQVRMRKAQALLMRPRARVAEVGAAVGYSDLYHFSKAFKQSVGMSPRNYRQELLLQFVPSE